MSCCRWRHEVKGGQRSMADKQASVVCCQPLPPSPSALAIGSTTTKRDDDVSAAPPSGRQSSSRRRSLSPSAWLAARQSTTTLQLSRRRMTISLVREEEGQSDGGPMAWRGDEATSNCTVNKTGTGAKEGGATLFGETRSGWREVCTDIIGSPALWL